MTWIHGHILVVIIIKQNMMICNLWVQDIHLEMYVSRHLQTEYLHHALFGTEELHQTPTKLFLLQPSDGLD